MRRWVLALGALAVASSALAQGVTGTVELTPTVGYWFGDTLTEGHDGSFDFDVSVDDDVSYGLRLAYRFSPGWALEGFITSEKADLVSGGDELFGGQEKLGEIDILTGTIGFEWSFGSSRLVPFLAAGIGFMNLDPTVPEMSSDTRFTGNFGGGFKLFLGPTTALRFDLRSHGVDVGDDDYDCDCWGCCYDEYNWVNFVEVGLGLTFVF